jgi:hypothetical protein
VATTIDPKRFPSLADYLSRLPAGLSSFPHAQSKGILLRSSVSGTYFHPSWEKLPPTMVDAMRHPPLPTQWVSSALTDAVFCAVADTLYPTEEAVVKWTYNRMVGLARVPMYSSLAKLAGLERFLRTVAKVHALFQRGTDLKVDVRGASAVVRLEHPPHLHGRLNHISNEGAFRGALEAAGARGVEVKLVESTPTLGHYNLRWSA